MDTKQLIRELGALNLRAVIALEDSARAKEALTKITISLNNIIENLYTAMPKEAHHGR